MNPPYQIKHEDMAGLHELNEQIAALETQRVAHLRKMLPGVFQQFLKDTGIAQITWKQHYPLITCDPEDSDAFIRRDPEYFNPPENGDAIGDEDYSVILSLLEKDDPVRFWITALDAFMDSIPDETWAGIYGDAARVIVTLDGVIVKRLSLDEY